MKRLTRFVLGFRDVAGLEGGGALPRQHNEYRPPTLAQRGSCSAGVLVELSQYVRKLQIIDFRVARSHGFLSGQRRRGPGSALSQGMS
jgi:hypothetical protein